MPDQERQDQILRLIRAIPEGFVTTYGDICPEAPRLPGRILRLSDDEKLPWHRVVRADGSFAKGERQRKLLEGEGIPFAGKRVDLETARMPHEALMEQL